MKLYVQLKPDTNSLELVQAVQTSLQLASDKPINFVKQAAVHLTILHIGATDRLIDSMAGVTNMKHSAILTHIDQLALKLEHVTNDVKDKLFTLQPIGYERFGVHGSAYVMTFQSTPELDDLHSTSLGILKRFFINCGIANVDTFMANDTNLTFALSLRPHVTVVKGYVEDSSLELGSMSFSIMPVRY